MTQVPPRSQDFQAFLAWYREAHADDVLVIRERVSDNQEVTALVQRLADAGRHPMLVLENVDGVGVPVVTNIFASRERVARILGVPLTGLHARYQDLSRRLTPPRRLERGPVLDVVQEGTEVDLASLPMIRHFETDRAPYITNAVVVGQHPDTGAGNLSYHRSMIRSRNEIATSLHSRGDLWRLLQLAQQRGQSLPVAMVIGAHPLFMLAASARVPFGVDEREVAGGLLGAPLDVVATPRHGILVPADAQYVLEGSIDPAAKAEEGPFGEFTGYSSDRSTNNLLRVDTILRRRDAVLVDVVGGHSNEHLNLARIPREAEMAEKLMQRFPGVTGLHYPNSGTHFHAYVGVRQMRAGEARQVMLGLLGWDPYLKTVIAVDPDVDITRDEQVLWAMATHFQPHRDLLMVDGLPGSPLDPSSTAGGTTSRMGIDATRGPEFHGTKAAIAPEALQRAGELLARSGS
jgi:2,5-furandicarboxylate decarboxylase 1